MPEIQERCPHGNIKILLGNGTYIIREYYNNGKLREECYYKGGKREGAYKSYYENGKLRMKCSYKDGKQEGTYEGYYENGKLRAKCSYKDGKLEGAFERYYDDGQLNVKCNFKDGKKEGLCQIWDDEGNVTITIYKNGEALTKELKPNDAIDIHKLLGAVMDNFEQQKVMEI